MNPSDISHSNLVANLAKSGIEITAHLTPMQAHMLHMTLGIAGEAGEVVDAVKKHVIYQKDLDRENIKEELGDIEFYMEGLRALLGLTREEVIDHNKAKLLKRYPTGTYTDAQARFRLDKRDEQHPFDGDSEGPCNICSHPLHHSIHVI